jgi:hypothetical protein
MAHYVITKGNPYRLLRNGSEILTGTWSECNRLALQQAEDTDLVTLGAACKRVSAGQTRREHNEHALLVELPHLVIRRD